MFNGLLEEILNEFAVTPDKITKAMDEHSKVIVTYTPVTKGREHATGPRLIGIFAYGQTKSSNDCVRVYEYAGDTATFVPGWKLLRLDQFVSWKPTGQKFSEPPDSKFNPNGDETMSVVFKVAQFNDGTSDTKDDEKGPKTNGELFLTPTERKLKQNRMRLKNQFDNPITISDFKAEKGMRDYKGGEDEYTEGPKTSKDVQPEEPKSSNYKDEVAKMFEPLKNKIKNAPKIDLNQNTKNTEAEKPVEEPETSEPSYKDEVRKQFEPLRDKIKNAPKIDLSQFDRFKNKLGDTSKPIKLRELKERLGIG